MNQRTETTVSINRTKLGDVEYIEIDYRDEPGPFYYVVVDGTPVLPEMPLPWDEAQRKAEQERTEDPDASIEVVECSSDDLKWARRAR
jgi:hypothetical protein